MAKHSSAARKTDADSPPVGATRRRAAQAAALDRLIHERIRLGIVSALAVSDSLTFNDLKGLLAYSTISHLGLITVLLGLNSELALVAALFHAF